MDRRARPPLSHRERAVRQGGLSSFGSSTGYRRGAAAPGTTGSVSYGPALQRHPAHAAAAPCNDLLDLAVQPLHASEALAQFFRHAERVVAIANDARLEQHE